MGQRISEILVFPEKGILETSGYGSVLDHHTLDALNVTPFNPHTNEQQGSKRAGTSRAIARVVDTLDSPVQRMLAVTLNDDEEISGFSFTDPFASVGSGDSGNGFGGGWLRPEPSYNGVSNWPPHDPLLTD